MKAMKRSKAFGRLTTKAILSLLIALASSAVSLSQSINLDEMRDDPVSLYGRQQPGIKRIGFNLAGESLMGVELWQFVCDQSEREMRCLVGRADVQRDIRKTHPGQQPCSVAISMRQLTFMRSGDGWERTDERPGLCGETTKYRLSNVRGPWSLEQRSFASKSHPKVGEPMNSICGAPVDEVKVWVDKSSIKSPMKLSCASALPF
jgi:hypothetical protein